MEAVKPDQPIPEQINKEMDNQKLAQIFENEFDCYTEHFNGKEVIAMTKEKFVSVVEKLLSPLPADVVSKEIKFTPEEVRAALETRDAIREENIQELKAVYMAGEIVMWHELRQSPSPSDAVSADMTVQEFYSGFDLTWMNEEERQTIYTATELYAKGKLRQSKDYWQRRAEAALELLDEIDESLYIGKDLDDIEILKWYINVVTTIKDSIKELKNQQP